jgi:PTH2 family peptidyl-tRNA hydrolase
MSENDKTVDIVKQHITTEKQVIVMRTDLSMNRGKIAAQAAHASWMTMLSISYREGNNLIIPLDERSLDWFDKKFTKTILAIDSEAELLEIYEKAKAAGLLSSLVIDSGLTTFNYVPTATCVGIGPDKSEKINEITGHLKPLNDTYRKKN